MKLTFARFFSESRHSWKYLLGGAVPRVSECESDSDCARQYSSLEPQFDAFYGARNEPVRQSGILAFQPIHVARLDEPEYEKHAKSVGIYNEESFLSKLFCENVSSGLANSDLAAAK